MYVSNSTKIHQAGRRLASYPSYKQHESRLQTFFTVSDTLTTPGRPAELVGSEVCLIRPRMAIIILGRVPHRPGWLGPGVAGV